MHKCLFCMHDGYNYHKKIFGANHIESFLLYKTDNFVVVPDIAPLTEGHMLIIPINHIMCCGDAIQKYPEEFIELKSLITRALKMAYGSCIFFEHGAVHNLRAGNSIDHAHLHCLPATVDILNNDNNSKKWQKLDSFLDLRTISSQNTAYLFFENASGIQSIHKLESPQPPLPSQYLRKAIAEKLGIVQWNWREMIHSPHYKNINRKRILDGVDKIRLVLSAERSS